MTNIQKKAERLLARYLRSSRGRSLRDVGPLLDVWFVIVDRVR
jgi:hypothetical protein